MRRELALVLGVVTLSAVGCSAGRVGHHSFYAPDGAHCQYTTYTANLNGPGLRRVDLFCDRHPVTVGTTYAVGPDVGVSLGTAGLQGAGIAGGAVLLGTSFPANKGTNVSANGGNASTSTNQNQEQAQSAIGTGGANMGWFNAPGNPPMD